MLRKGIIFRVWHFKVKSYVVFAFTMKRAIGGIYPRGAFHSWHRFELCPYCHTC